MKSILRLLSALLLWVGGVSAFAQSGTVPDTVVVQPLAQSQEEGRAWAEIRKPYFRNTRSDSLFVVNNSDEPFRYDYYSQAEDLGVFGPMFFKANVGDVVGPMFLEGYAILYKIAGFDSVYRIRASQLYFKPDGKSRRDSLQALKKANQYLAQVQQGGSFETLLQQHVQAQKDESSGDLGWLWQGYMIGPFDQALANAKKGDVLVIKSPLGAHLVKVTEDKVLDRGRVRVVPLMKKL
jgi:parvulin-like peptidyl-prolyl isomerase